MQLRPITNRSNYLFRFSMVRQSHSFFTDNQWIQSTCALSYWATSFGFRFGHKMNFGHQTSESIIPLQSIIIIMTSKVSIRTLNSNLPTPSSTMLAMVPSSVPTRSRQEILRTTLSIIDEVLDILGDDVEQEL